MSGRCLVITTIDVCQTSSGTCLDIASDVCQTSHRYLLEFFSESLRSEKCSSHIVAGQTIGLKHCQKSYIDVKIDYHQSGAFHVLTSGETPGSPLGKTAWPLRDLCETSGKKHAYGHKTSKMVQRLIYDVGPPQPHLYNTWVQWWLDTICVDWFFQHSVPKNVGL